MILSVVVPVFNEEKNVVLLHKRLKTVLPKLTKNYEIIFINDGSHDSSLSILKSLRKKDKTVKIISFSRNFGHMAAVSAGLRAATGKKVVVMDADLQDPPEVIAKMYAKSNQGYEVVYGVKEKRKEQLLKRLAFSVFYQILNRITHLKMPLNAGTFSILDRKVVEILNTLPERNKYFSGMRVWAGFSQAGIVYERDARRGGKSSSLQKLTKLALDGLLSFSFLPLRIASMLGFFFSIVAFFIIVFVILGRLILGFGVVGWTSTLSIVLLLGGIQLITLGVIGEYIARIFDEVKARPEYIIEEKFGL